MLATLIAASTVAIGPFDEAWDVVERAIRATYYARESRFEQMDRWLDETEPQARASTTRQEFAGHVNRLAARFGDSHFGFVTDMDQGFFLSSGIRPDTGEVLMPNVGAWFRPAAEGWTISMLFPDDIADEAGLRVGDVILTAAGEPFEPILSLAGSVQQNVDFEVRRGETVFAVRIAPDVDPPDRLFLEATRQSGELIQHADLSFGYIKLWATLTDEFGAALREFLLTEARDSDGFVLDLRGGIGGRPEGIVDPFFVPPSPMTWDLGAEGLSVDLPLGYAGPLVVLIDRDTRSAKEVIAHVLKSSGRATLIGETTAGEVLGTFPILVEDWGVLSVPRADLFVDGVRLENVGVSPHFAVTALPSETDPDPALRLARDVLAREVARANPDSG